LRVPAEELAARELGFDPEDPEPPDVPTGTEFSVTWGREHFAPVSYTGFDVGPFSATSHTREGESLAAAIRRLNNALEAVAISEFKLKMKSFLQRLRETATSVQP